MKEKIPVGIVYGIVHSKNIQKYEMGVSKNGEVTFKLWRGWWWKWFSQPRDFGVFCDPSIFRQTQLNPDQKDIGGMQSM